MATRPNFLFLITDQHRFDYLGCSGHPVLKTPHIDFDRRARHAVRALLRGDAGLHAQPRDPDDRADAVGARRAQQRHAAAAAVQHVRRRAARRRLRDGAGRQEPPAEFHRHPGGPQTAAAARRRPGARRELRRGEQAVGVRRTLRPGASQALGGRTRFRHEAAVLRLRACRSVHGARRPGRRPLLCLAQVAAAPTRMRCATARTSCRTTTSVRRPIRTPIPEELYPTSYIADKSCEWLDRYAAGEPRPAVLPDGVVPGPASSVHAARPLLVDVPAAGHGAAAELRSRQPAVGARAGMGARAARSAGRPSSPSRPPSRSTSGKRARRWR